MSETIQKQDNLTDVVNYRNTDSLAPFRKTREQWGGFSNMAGGFPVTVNGMTFQSSEGLYQALKFPHDTTAQRAIAQASNGYRSKIMAYAPGNKPMPGWDEVRIDAMRVALAFKLDQQPRFGAMLISSAGRTIVENSSRDPFWGARPVNGGYQGSNILGKLLTELRSVLMETPGRNRRQAAVEFMAGALGEEFMINNQVVAMEQESGQMP